MDLIRRWSLQLDNTIDSEIELAKPDGSKVPGLLISHGQHKILIAVEGQDYITVTYRIDLLETDQDKLAKMDSQDYMKLTNIIKRALIAGRSGFNFALRPKTDIIKSIIIVQRMKVSQTDPSTFNHFSDSIQEMVNEGFMVAMILGATFRESGAQSISSAPESMYR